MSENVLELRDLTKVYKRSHLGRTRLSRGVEGISLDVHRGEVFGLLGLNGSGKTTTIKLILGLLFPTSGQIRLFGEPVPNHEAQRRIGYLPEVPYFYRNLTPIDVLGLYAALSGLTKKETQERVEEVLRLVKMDHVRTKPMREFSKGMLQRIGLAQSLIHNPDFFILDEPVTGLDPLGIRQTRELMANMNHEGKTIFFSSHSISELERLAHRVAILVEGKLVRLLNESEWKSQPGRLETLFMETLESVPQADRIR